MDDLSYDDICKHIGHLYLTSQKQVQRKEKEILAFMVANQELQGQINKLKEQLAAKETDDAARTEGTSS